MKTYQSVQKKDLLGYNQKQKKNFISSAFRCERKDISAEKKITYKHFKSLYCFLFRFILKRLQNIMCFVLPCALIWEKILILLLISILRRLAELYIWLVAEILELSFLKSQKFLRKLSTVCFTTQNLGKLLITFIIWITTRYQRYFFFLFFKGSQWNYLLFAKFRK